MAVLAGAWMMAASAAWAASEATWYAGFNNGKVSDTPYPGYAYTPIVYAPGKIGEGLRIAKGIPGVSSVRIRNDRPGLVHPTHGSIAYWIKLNQQSAGTPTEIMFLGVDGGCFQMAGRFLPSRPDPAKPGETLGGSVSFETSFLACSGGALSQSIRSSTFSFQSGDWHHVVWTWLGIDHRIYVDGTLRANRRFDSPFPPNLAGMNLGSHMGGTQDITIDEFAVYNFTLSAEEVQAAFQSNTSAPLVPFSSHGPELNVQWGPGVGKAHVALLAGSDFEDTAAAVRVEVTHDGALVKTARLGPLRSGFVEALVDLGRPERGGSLAPGRYELRASLLDGADAVLATAAPQTYELPDFPWLGHTIGMTDTVQPPWTPIQANGLTFSVWGRDYAFGGGFGLPQQITSQSKPLLGEPVRLDLTVDGAAVSLSPEALAVTSASDTTATWEGAARGGGVKATVLGRLEYDGFVQIRLRLEPEGPPVTINAAALHTALPPERALYLWAPHGDGFWWNPNSAILPSALGLFKTNKDFAHAGMVPMFVFSDDDRGLEWFAETMQGWQADYNKPLQEVSRDNGGTVRLINRFVNKTYTLAKPIEIAFGYEATPIKPLPADWRLARVGDYGDTPMEASSVKWIWHDMYSRAGQNPGEWGGYQLAPSDIGKYAAWVKPIQNAGWKAAHYTQQHTTLPTGDVTWNDLAFLNPENENDGYYSAPSKGSQDYWAYWFDRMVAAGAADGLYMDEPFLASAKSWLSGFGWVGDDGAHHSGYYMTGERQQLRRLRQVLTDRGRAQPWIWLHSTGNLYPHAWAFADILSDGETAPYIYMAPCEADFIDNWASREAWLRTIGRAQKYGMIQAWLEYTRGIGPGRPEDYYPLFRSRVGFLANFDINPLNSNGLWNVYQRWKRAFGIVDPDVRFTGYWMPEQTAVRADRADVRASHYTKAGAALVFVTNWGGPYSGQVMIDPTKLGLDPARTTIYTMETRTPLPLQDGAVRLTLARHDFALLHLIERPAGTAPPAPPVRTRLSPYGLLPVGATQATLTLETDKDAVCRYDSRAGIAYASMTKPFTQTGGRAHSVTLTGLRAGTENIYFVRCMDADGRANADDLQVLWVNPSLSPANCALPEPIQVTLDAPADNAVVSGTITFSATALVRTALSSLEFQVGNLKAGAAPLKGNPYQLAWDTRQLPDGEYAAVAVARDYGGWSARTAESKAVRLRINNHGTYDLPPEGEGILPELRLDPWEGAFLRLNDEIVLAYAPPGGLTVAYTWDFEEIGPPAPGAAGVASLDSSRVSRASVSARTSAPRFTPSSQGLVPGRYRMTVTATAGAQSRSASASVTLTASDLGGIKVYPNPHRADRHAGTGITFANLPAQTSVRLFTASGRLVREQGGLGGQWVWDLHNESGQRVASGLYLYVLSDPRGGQARGKIVVAR